MTRLECLFRSVLLALMFATFWVPVGNGPYEPLGLTSLVLAGMTLTGEIAPFFPTFPSLMGLPVLFLLNIWLLWQPSRSLRIFYRILLAFVVSVKWYEVIEWELWKLPHFWLFWGVLVECVLISVGALCEVWLMLSSLRSNPERG